MRLLPPRLHGRLVLAAAMLALFASVPDASAGQSVEIAPFGGYRLGASIDQVSASPVVDDDGGVSFGVVVDVVFGPANDGLKVEGVFSHQEATLKVRRSLLDPPTTARAQVDHLLLGGSQDLGDGRVRPFLSGLLGLTRYAVPGDTEVRFAIGAGTGLKAYLTRHLGLRLDARGYLTLISLSGRGICGGYGCAIQFSTNPAFQADLTAGVIVAF